MVSYRDETGTAVPLPQGLLAWMQGQGPEVWHAFARSVRFGAPHATIDLLLTADWISRQPGCDRATAVLLLARAVEAGLETHAPVAMDDAAAQAFCADLQRRLATGAAPARFALMQTEQRLVARHFALDAELRTAQALQSRSSKSPQAAYQFAGNRPVQMVEAGQHAA
jgi:hypothetical protein